MSAKIQHLHFSPHDNTTTDPAATTEDQDSSATASLARRVITRITGGGIGGGGGSSGNNNAESGTYVRRAHHAGSWYSSNTKQLNTTLGRYLSDAEEDLSNNPPVPGGNGMPRGIISPHAGYDYSGPSAAFSYLALTEFLTAKVSAHHHPAGTQQDITVVVLHPSHHVYLSGAAVSGATVIRTPLCVDDNLRQSLVKTGKFSTMEQHVDEAEHSGEMQYPYIAKVINDVLGGGDCSTSFHVKVLPIMIGATSTSQEQKFGRILAPFLAQPHVFTVVSSDFCHWGKRFSYYPHLSSNPDDGSPFNQIADYIEWLDRKGMTKIEMQNPGAFATYLKEHSNTICGRHPIAVWLESVAANKQSGFERVNVAFVKYDQSSRVSTVDESSVSYASAVARLATATVATTEHS